MNLRIVKILIFVIVLSFNSKASTGTWESKVTKGEITYKITDPDSPLKDKAGYYLTIVYLENLNFTKIGANSHETDVAWLLSQGYRVIELDYKTHVNAFSPAINADIIAINDALAAGSFCGLSTCSKYRSYVLFEGYRLARDVAYFKDDPTIYNYPANYTSGDSLYMDIIYPANTIESVPVVLSFSYSNSYHGNEHDRLNLGYTFAGFNDSFLEGSPANGIAWAIADHPKYCNWGSGKPAGGANDAYKSYQTNPDAAKKVKSAVRTLRVLGDNLGLSGKIGIYGFSRGSSAGSMAIGDLTDSIVENAGLNNGVSDNVQAAALGSGVFDFTKIYNFTDDGDKNLEVRCPWVWGPLDENYELWRTMGAAYLVNSKESAPVFFFYNTTDSHHYKDQIKNLKAKLDSLNVPNSSLIDYGTGHSVPQTSSSLSELYKFFNQYLEPPIISNIVEVNVNSDRALGNMLLTLSPNPVVDKINLEFNIVKTGKVQIFLFNLAGVVLYQTEKMYNTVGPQNEIIYLDKKTFPEGMYIVKVTSSEMQDSAHFERY